MASAWIYSIGRVDASVARHYASALRDAGVDIEDPENQRTSPYGILIYREPNEDVVRFLKEASNVGQTRILALGLLPRLCAGEAWLLLEAGACDVLAMGHNRNAAAQVKARIERWAAVDALTRSSWVRERMVGASPLWRAKLRELVEAARFTSSPVLLMGESGTGKELAANLIHEFDSRSAKANLVVLDCTTIVPDLSGSEFFGHERGAFTGAVAQREGAFALADGGTLFLDEIGELPLPLQAQLLRVIQERTYKRVGGNAWKRTEFRLVCATNRNLEEQVRRGEFRADLYFRVASLVFTLPSLRERTDDILPLAYHFMREMRPDEEPPELDEATQDYLLRHDYRGNARELKQLVSRLMHRYVGGGVLSVGSIPLEERPSPGDSRNDWQGDALEQAIRRAIAFGAGLKEISRTAEDIAVRIAVDAAEGNLQRAAQALGVTDRALQMRRANRKPADEVGELRTG